MNRQTRPPKFFQAFFRWFCNPEYLEDIEGDLEERYYNSLSKGKRVANWYFVMEVLRLFRPGIIRSFAGSTKMNQYGIFRNYIKVSWRNVKRQKLYSILNIGGLSVGLACSMIIVIFVYHEFQYDKFYINAEEIYRIYQKQPGNESLGTDFYAVTPAALAPTLMKDYGEVNKATTVLDISILIESEYGNFMENCIGGDEHFFDVFHMEFIKGTASNALQNAQSIVLTESLSKKIFGEENPIGKTVSFWNKEAFVTGIIKDPPSMSSIPFSAIFSIKASNYYLQEVKKTRWNGNSYHTFLTLNAGNSPDILEAKMPELLNKHWIHADIPNEYYIESLLDIHLHPYINEDLAIKGNPEQLMLFSIVALLVVVLASVNYMNLSIARSINRAKEVGLRKVIGANRTQLIYQFLVESVLLAFISLAGALVLVYLTLPWFSQLVSRQLEWTILFSPHVVFWLLAGCGLVGVISGCYPALFISSLNPIIAFREKLKNRSSTSLLQRGLIIGQYTISITLVICSMMIFFQFQYIQNKALGFEREQVLIVEARGNTIQENIEVIKSEWLKNPSILNVSASSSPPTYIQSSTFLKNDKTGGQIYRLYTDLNFLDLYNIQLISGRFFSADFSEDRKNNRVINESAARALGFEPESAIGEQFTNEGGHKKNIIGVVNDFHMHSMHLPIAPLMIGLSEDLRYVSVKVSPENVKETIIYLEESFKDYSPYPFNYQFVDDHFDQLYEDDRKQASLVGFFTTLSIIIASLGLFGLAAFSTQQRIKEIGIRKVLGASVAQITSLITSGFLRLVLIGLVIAIPVAWIVLDRWLDNFAYHVDLEWWVFAAAGLISVVFSILTVASQSIRAATTNPVNCLHDE